MEHHKLESHTLGKTIYIDKEQVEDPTSFDIGVSEDKPNYSKFMGWSVLVLCFVCLIVIGLSSFDMDNYDKQNNLSKDSHFLEVHQLNMKQHRHLSRYGIIDAEKGIYHAPITDVFSIIIKDYAQK